MIFTDYLCTICPQWDTRSQSEATLFEQGEDLNQVFLIKNG